MKFSEAANTLYAFVWHEFCDWYLEFSKPVLYGEDSKHKQSTQLVLAQTLNRIVRLLHPFIPFITEEIYQKLPIHDESCVIADYPTLENDKTWLALGSKEAAFKVEMMKRVITAIRNIRGENSIKPGEKIAVWLEPKGEASRKILSDSKAEIMRLGSLSACELSSPESLSKCAISPLNIEGSEINVIVPLEGLVDIEKEISRLSKAIEKNEKEIKKLSGKLNNKRFIENAPADVVEADKALLAQFESKVQHMQSSLLRLKD